jgi:hypothetical protein
VEHDEKIHIGLTSRKEEGKMKIEVTQVKSGIRFAMKRESGKVLFARFIPFNHKEKDRKVVFEMSVKEEKRKDVG